LYIESILKCIEVIVGVVYRPGGDVMAFLADFEETLSTVVPNSDYVFCLGDFNINAFNTFNNSFINFTTLLDSFCLQQLITDPTRVTPYSSTLIDFVLVSSDLGIAESGVRDVRNLADHRVVYCVSDLDPGPSAPIVRSFRNYSSFNYQNFYSDLTDLPWNNILYLNSIDEKVELFNNLINTIFDKHAPFITRTFTGPYKPWHTQTIKDLMRRRDNARKQFKRTNDPDNLAYYRQLRNFTTYAQRHEKRVYLNECCKTGDSKRLWSNLNKFGIQAKRPSMPEHFRDVNAINDYFASIQSMAAPDTDLFTFYNNNVKDTVTEQLVFSLCTEEDVLKIISTISSNAVGADGISVKMLSLCCPFISKYLCHIFNTCLLDNVYPTCWKESIVIPLPKCPKASNLSDLRPISILSVLSKILEKIISLQLRQHLVKNKILPDSQSGFREGYSCATALASICDDILRNTDNGFLTALVLLDYSKAFDNINHNLLLSILHYVGLGEGSVELFRQYLSDRFQRVVLSGVSSGPVFVGSGVPQGSVLGPLLFSIYTSTFQRSVMHSKVHMYADDTQIYHSINIQNLEVDVAQLNSDINELVQVSEKHGLSINSSKCCLIIFGNRSIRSAREERIKISVKDDVLSVQKHARNLGLYLDSDLRFKVHVTKCLQYAYSTLKLLFSHRHILNQELKKLLCDSLVLSKLNYCDTVYNSCLDSIDIRRIQVLQNSCLRFIYGMRRRDHITSALLRSGWLRMCDRRLLHSAVFYHRIITKKTPPYLYNKIRFRTDIHNINIRHRHVITIPAHNIQLFKRSFSYCVAHIYNKIPLTFKTLSVNYFKNKLKSLIVGGQFNL